MPYGASSLIACIAAADIDVYGITGSDGKARRKATTSATEIMDGEAGSTITESMSRVRAISDISPDVNTAVT